MRADLAPFALDLMLAFAGLGVLVAIGSVPLRVSAVLAAFGLAYLTGTAVVPTVMVALLVLGVPFTIATAVFVTALCVLAGGIAAWRRRPEQARSARKSVSGHRSSIPLDSWIVGGFAVVLAAFAVIGMVSAFRLPLTEWDAWSIWARKAQMLTVHDSLIEGFWTSTSYSWIHLDYPLQYPVWEALHFRAAGSFETQALLRHVWLLVIAFAWSVAYMVRNHVRPVVWAPLVLAVVAAPGVWQQLLTGYADVPMAMFACLGAIALALWLGTRDGRSLALAAIMLAAAANTKNEGLMAVVAMLIVAGLICLARDLPLRQFVFASGVVIVAILPWRLWIAAHGIKGDLPVTDGINPAFLLGRTERVWPAIRALANELADQGRWLYVLPLAALVVAASVVSGVGRRIAVFYLASFLLAWAGLVWSYWISPNPIDWHLATSANRVITVLVFICIAALVHLSGLLIRSLALHDRAGQCELGLDPIEAHTSTDDSD